MKKLVTAGSLAIAAIALASSAQSSFAASPETAQTAALDTSGPALVVPIPNVSAAGKKFSFDLGLVDHGIYYLTDRTNKAVDMIDTATNQLIGQIKGTGDLAFAGSHPDNENSGPDGINRITGTNKLYVGDVNSVKVVDSQLKTVVKSIIVSNTGNRADEGCYDPDHHIAMFSSPADAKATWINADTDEIIAQFSFPDGTSGLEQCAYDRMTQSFFVNNDGTQTYPSGELDRISVASVLAHSPQLDARYPLGACVPAGLALGPGNEMLVGCDPDAGNPLISLIVDRVNGRIQQTIPFGGVDQVTYDEATRRYYLAARHWVNSGIAGDSYNPVIGIIDANSKKLVAELPAGDNAHSVAVDPVTHQVYAPFAPTPGNQTFANGGVAVYRPAFTGEDKNANHSPK